jgi:hypothetical protein
MIKGVLRQAIGAFSFMAVLLSCAGGSPLAPEQEAGHSGQSPAVPWTILPMRLKPALPEHYFSLQIFLLLLTLIPQIVFALFYCFQI